MRRLTLWIFALLTCSGSLLAQQQVYEFRTYELEFFRPADVLHKYFENALIPALNRQGIRNIGAFEETGEALPKKVYLLIAYDDIQAFQGSKTALLEDAQYLADAEGYLTADPQSMPYKRYSTNLIQSTTGFPVLTAPEGEAGLFELRIYESYNEDALRRKVKMFNESEFGIFKDVGLPVVFFGSNIAGEQMPCLTYMLAFKDKADHAAAWARFGPHPEWQRITKLEEYFNAMDDITRVFLKPLPYSQL
ncbi:NIPSNAP family protein [Robiginitalea sp. SC105]|uniref:NIPSNAP family protein n=1 Tax=Robiginitalea sp. SC105 TaxID=2762332 RepID=UPI00163ACFAF|nr:NIPSNAP family protein [Robiginitalea sp. SC105]MBC2840054.1 NIPSNAP family protein [Robiginitalea sp. SC105]